MKLTEEVDKPFVHSSFKVKELLNLIERFNNQFLTDKDDCNCESPQQKESFKILVFVERKLTARVLYQILKVSILKAEDNIIFLLKELTNFLCLVYDCY